MARHDENAAFTCLRCGARVEPLTNGSYRNHCPVCLWSRHVDGPRPGDRTSACRGLMEPVELRCRNGRQQIVHRCTRCGFTRPNRIASNTVQPDDFERVLHLSSGLRTDLGEC